MYMLISCYQKAGQKHNMKIMNRSFQGVAEFLFGNNTNRL
jgi:hypothetical protein